MTFELFLIDFFLISQTPHFDKNNSHVFQFPYLDKIIDFVTYFS